MRRIVLIVSIGMSALAVDIVATPAPQCMSLRSAWECLRGPVTAGSHCDATCTDGGGTVCQVTITWSCHDCQLNNWDKVFFSSRAQEGTNIRRTVCSDGTSLSEWRNAPCGWCGVGRNHYLW